MIVPAWKNCKKMHCEKYHVLAIKTFWKKGHIEGKRVRGWAISFAFSFRILLHKGTFVLTLANAATMDKRLPHAYTYLGTLLRVTPLPLTTGESNLPIMQVLSMPQDPFLWWLGLNQCVQNVFSAGSTTPRKITQILLASIRISPFGTGISKT